MENYTKILTDHQYTYIGLVCILEVVLNGIQK